jgi:hypothetical protein
MSSYSQWLDQGCFRERYRIRQSITHVLVDGHIFRKASSIVRLETQESPLGTDVGVSIATGMTIRTEDPRIDHDRLAQFQSALVTDFADPATEFMAHGHRQHRPRQGMRMFGSRDDCRAYVEDVALQNHKYFLKRWN